MATSDVRDRLQATLGSAYTLERELGRGGMATVYLARDTKHGRLVALKVLHPDLAASLGPERFRREITTAAQLQHPHILSVYDSGETAAGQLWFTMPYVEGESLRDRLRRDKQLPVEDALRIAREVADALDYAHQHDVIHRDIKPENVLLTGTHALLADFGIARALTASKEGTGLTETGLAMGTPQYMSPEQASGERELTPRSDIYALGAVLYEMLAGEPPFTGPTPQAVIAKMMSSEAPSVRRSRPAVPESVDAALRRALAPVPADRWASAGEFARALDAAERTGGNQMAGVPPSARRIPVAALTLGLGFLIGAGVLFAWLAKSRAGMPATSSGAVRLAVLPFENVGDSSDAYFADGMTEAVRDKLTGVPGLEVIGSTSSGQYRKTTKTAQQIGQELGVRYLLEGRVRWAKGPGGASRVRVSPELVDAGSAADKWAAPFDAPMTDVFQVQSDIAGKVAQQLQVALTPAAQQTLASRPTANLAAYDAYLRGKELLKSDSSGGSFALLHRGTALFQDAVNRDSTFALAWSALSSTQAFAYFLGTPTPVLADSVDRNSARALAVAPDLPAAHLARAFYYGAIRRDAVRALHEDSAALALAPHDAEVVGAISFAETSLGRWDAAEAHAQEAARLDPRSVEAAVGLGSLELYRRHYAESQAAFDHAQTLAPASFRVIHNRMELALAKGDLSGARAILLAVPPSVDRNNLVTGVALFDDLGWTLDSSDAERLLGLGPDLFDGDRGVWGLVLAQQYAFRGDLRRSRAYADTARVAFASHLKGAPADPQLHVELGLALAFLDDKAEAIREGERGVALSPITRNGHLGPYVQHQLARIYILVGEPEKALDALEPLLKMPYTLSPAWLRIDPNFLPLRGNPRFERLAAGEPPIA